MKRCIHRLLLVPLLMMPAAAMAEEQKSAPAPDIRPACVKVSEEARFVGLAYNHLVHLENTCGYKVTCQVKTNVNPKKSTVTLKPGEKKTHLTFRGSPARVFESKVACRR